MLISYISEYQWKAWKHACASTDAYMNRGLDWKTQSAL